MINTDENITKGNENVTYKEARVYLDKVSKYGSVLGLGTIHKLLCELDHPEDELKFIHIAGTNGKGSVLAYTSTILSKAGYRVGRYLSPTVVSYLERIQVDGQWIPRDAFARLTALVKEAIARMEAAGETSPTVFEAETAIVFERTGLRLGGIGVRAWRRDGRHQRHKINSSGRLYFRQPRPHGDSREFPGRDRRRKIRNHQTGMHRCHFEAASGRGTGFSKKSQGTWLSRCHRGYGAGRIAGRKLRRTDYFLQRMG